MKKSANDEKLLAGINKRDINAIHELHRSIFKELCDHACIFIKDENYAKDIASSVFKNFLNGNIKTRFVNLTHARQYFFRAVKNGCFDLLKSPERKLWQPQSAELNEIPDVPDDEYINNERIRLLNDIIQRLPEHKHFVITQYYAGVSYEKIALQLNTSVKYVRNLRARVIKELKKAFGLLHSVFIILLIVFVLHCLLLCFKKNRQLNGVPGVFCSNNNKIPDQASNKCLW